MTVPGDADEDSRGWLPSTSQDQSCAFCGAVNVLWVHPLALDRVRYRRYGKGHTLPGFWTVCDGCERLVAAGADHELLTVMKGSDGWLWTTDEDVQEDLGQALGVFRRADLGARPLPKQ